MNRNMRKIQRATAAVLAAVMAASTLSVSIASAPEVTTEETAYITLDQYGEQTDVSIVKAVDLNGNTGFTDYGRYESVVNMSTGDQPQITDEGVEWDLRSAGKDRFYYQVKTRDGTMDIPWTIDVSYSLNGVPTAAEELAGILEPSRYVGRAPRQVEEFLDEVIRPVLEENKEVLGMRAEILV